MKIKIVENRLDGIPDVNYRNVIRFIIEAVKDYPMYNLDNTEDYFEELKEKLNSSEINLHIIETGLKNSYVDESENAVWVQTSLSTLIEAFTLMEIHQIKFEEILVEIKSLN